MRRQRSIQPLILPRMLDTHRNHVEQKGTFRTGVKDSRYSSFREHRRIGAVFGCFRNDRPERCLTPAQQSSISPSAFGQRTHIRSSRTASILLMLLDSTKFGKVSTCSFAPMKDFSVVITDQGISAEYAQDIRAQCPELLIVGTE